MKSLWRKAWLTTILLVCAPAMGLADQTDQRLDDLFHTLQTSHDSAQLSEVEAAI